MKAGLHCGGKRPTWFHEYRLGVLPAVKAGLHCGESKAQQVWAEEFRVLPAVKAGLHCGPEPVASGVSMTESSRP